MDRVRSKRCTLEDNRNVARYSFRRSDCPVNSMTLSRTHAATVSADLAEGLSFNSVTFQVSNGTVLLYSTKRTSGDERHNDCPRVCNRYPLLPVVVGHLVSTHRKGELIIMRKH